MSYLRAVLNESECPFGSCFIYLPKLLPRRVQAMRFNPVVAIVNRGALNDTVLPTGGGPDRKAPVFVKKGSVVFIVYRALHRNPSVWGVDADVYRPERWLESQPKSTDFLPFGA